MFDVNCLAMTTAMSSHQEAEKSIVPWLWTLADTFAVEDRPVFAEADANVFVNTSIWAQRHPVSARECSR